MKNLQKIDKSNLRQVILDFPKQFKIGIEAAKNISVPSLKRPISNIVICGMGGSALPGDLLQLFNNYLQLTTVPILIHRDYGLPPEADKNSLIICISYSGDTEETISVLKETIQRRLKVTIITSGGTFIDISKRKKIPYARIPAGLQPRCAIGYQFSALIKILINLGVIKNIEKDLLALETSLTPRNLETSGKKIARKLKGYIPLVYTSRGYIRLVRIWKIKFNENSKIPAFFNVFPELNHNEMVGTGECKIKDIREKFIVIILEDRQERPKILRRMRILSQVFQQRGIKTVFIELKGKNIIEKIFSSLTLADWVSYYLAINQKIDPAPVALAEEFKTKMNLR